MRWKPLVAHAMIGVLAGAGIAVGPYSEAG
jgi:hypothetical protein